MIVNRPFFLALLGLLLITVAAVKAQDGELAPAPDGVDEGLQPDVNDTSDDDDDEGDNEDDENEDDDENNEEEKKEEVCHTDLKGESGRFATKNFPEDYESNTNCTWNITNSDNKRIRLTFHLFNVEHNRDCTWDWVRVSDGNGTLLKHICGLLQQDLVIDSYTDLLQVQFFTDGVVNSPGFLASWTTIDEDIKDEDNEDDNETSEEKPAYLLGLPQTFLSTSESSNEEQLCLQLFNVPSKGVVKISLFTADNILVDEPLISHEQVVDGTTSEVDCFDMALPNDFKNSTAVIEVKGEFEESKYKILSYKSVRALRLQPMFLIQTDKGDYSPGQKVYVRILALNHELKASVLNRLDEIWVTNPLKQRIAQWKDVELDRGLVQRDFVLDEEPQLGTWNVHLKYSYENEEQEDSGSDASERSASFSVSERVLPRYELLIRPPSTILNDTDEAAFEICAQYTHGSRVKGSLEAFFKAEYRVGNYWRSPLHNVNVTKKYEEVQGCIDVVLNRTELTNLTSKNAEIELSASFKELGTEEMRDASWKGKVETTFMKLDFQASPEQHILDSSFPYVGLVRSRSHDNSILPNTKLELCLRLFSGIDEMRKFAARKAHRLYYYTEDQLIEYANRILGIKQREICFQDIYTNEQGILEFAVPLEKIEANVTKLSVKVKASDYPSNEETGMTQPEAVLDVLLTRPSVNNSLASALTIGKSQVVDEKRSFGCEKTTVPIFFSAQRGQSVRLSYYASSAGGIVLNGTVDAEVQEQSDEQVRQQYLGQATTFAFPEENNEEDTEENKELVLQRLDLELERGALEEWRISKTLKLLVFTMGADGRTLSASAEFEADTCGPQPKIAFVESNAEVRPGQNVKLNIMGEPKALCGFGVTDKSVQLAGNANAITPKRLQELRENLSEKRRVQQRRRRVQEKCENANLLFRDFLDLGLYVMSDLLDVSTECDTLVDITDKRTRDNSHPQPVPVVAFAAVEDDLDGGVQNNVQFEEAQVDYVDAQPLAQSAPVPPPALDRTMTTTVAAKRPASAEPSLSSDSDEIEENEVELRNYFPETWLFELIDLEQEGQKELKLETPHTVTTWVAEAVCLDDLIGVSVANLSELVVKQDFFADLYMPYAVKRGEIVPINVSAFNTVKKRSLPMAISVIQSDDFDLVNINEEESQEENLGKANFCLDSEDNQLNTFYLKAQKLNEVNVSVEAKIANNEALSCDNSENAEGFTDVLQKVLHVKPEGFEQEKIENIFECKENTEPKSIVMKKLDLPEDLVKDSERAWVHISGDVLAPSLSNLDRLVTMPTGCGEQNIISMAPNVYLLEYLRGTERNIVEIENEAMKHIVLGYERQQKYRHDDGSFSVWGPEQDEQGSMWLTAFVTKVFGQASKFVDREVIAGNKLQQSIDWIVRQQKKSGCFANRGYVIHGDLKRSKEALTASVLLTLLEVQLNRDDVRIDEEVVDRAVNCLLEKETNGTYAETIVVYALSLRRDQLQRRIDKHNNPENIEQDNEENEEEKEDNIEEKEELNSKLSVLEDRITSGLNSLLLSSNSTASPTELFWTSSAEEESSHKSKARSVEITAYNILSLTASDRLPEALKAVKWLATQRNSRGGFVSTQDTMVALQALSEYSIKIGGQNNEYSVVVKGDEQDISVDVNEDNKLLLQRQKIHTLPAQLEAEIKGQGCFLIQTVLRYNVKESREKEAFSLSASVSDESKLRLCASYTGKRLETDMVVVEVELLSGFGVREASLERLLNEVEAPIKRYEVDEKEGKVVLYLEELGNKQSCWEFEIKRETRVEELKDAVVKIYDYYTPEEVVSIKYNLD